MPLRQGIICSKKYANIDIEKNMNIDIGIDIDIEEIKSIFVNFYGIFAGLIYIIFETNFIQLP